MSAYVMTGRRAGKTRAAAQIEEYLGRFCNSCWRPPATDADWAAFEGGEGDHLCWESSPESCPWEFQEPSRQTRLAEALVAAGLTKEKP